MAILLYVRGESREEDNIHAQRIWVNKALRINRTGERCDDQPQQQGSGHTGSVSPAPESRYSAPLHPLRCSESELVAMPSERFTSDCNNWFSCPEATCGGAATFPIQCMCD